MPDRASIQIKPQNLRWKSRTVEISPFSGGSGGQFLVRTKSDGHCLVPEPLVVLLKFFDGTRTVDQVAAEFSQTQGSPVTGADVQAVIEKELAPKGLVGHPIAESLKRPPKVQKKFDFIFRFPLLSAQQITFLTDRLLHLYQKYLALVLVVLVTGAHIAFYSQPFAKRFPASRPQDLITAYAAMFVIVLFHELGHASACRRFACEHDEIGFCLYLVFPAMYANLSRAWRLSAGKRAVIDAGGIYFQQLMFMPVVAAHVLLHKAYLANVLYAIDIMSIVSLNPFLKCDGYWLLADCSGIANLQGRALALVRGAAGALAGKHGQKPLFANLTVLQKCILSVYTALLCALIAFILPRVVLGVPGSFHRIAAEAIALGKTHNDPLALLLHLRGLLLSALWIPLFFRVVFLMKNRLAAYWSRSK